LAPGDLNGAKSAYQPGHYYIVNTNGSGKLEQETYSHKNAKIRNFFKQSALIRYVMMNIQFQRKITFGKKAHSTASSPSTPPLIYHRFFIKELCHIAHAGDFNITLLISNSELDAFTFDIENKKCSRINAVNAVKIMKNLKTDSPLLRLDFAPYDGHWNATMHGHVYTALKKKLAR
ncbi:MAG: hypothetical protein COB76_01025, partial [Alphaproteobacteria bacterium]